MATGALERTPDGALPFMIGECAGDTAACQAKDWQHVALFSNSHVDFGACEACVASSRSIYVTNYSPSLSLVVTLRNAPIFDLVHGLHHWVGNQFFLQAPSDDVSDWVAVVPPGAVRYELVLTFVPDTTGEVDAEFAISGYFTRNMTSTSRHARSFQWTKRIRLSGKGIPNAFGIVPHGHHNKPMEVGPQKVQLTTTMFCPEKYYETNDELGNSRYVRALRVFDVDAGTRNKVDAFWPEHEEDEPAWDIRVNNSQDITFIIEPSCSSGLWHRDSQSVFLFINTSLRDFLVPFWYRCDGSRGKPTELKSIGKAPDPVQEPLSWLQTWNGVSTFH